MDDGDAIELHSGGQLSLILLPVESVVTNHDPKAFLHLAAVGFALDLGVDPVPSVQPGARLADDAGEVLKRGLGGAEQGFALAGFLTQAGVEAYREALTGEVGVAISATACSCSSSGRNGGCPPLSGFFKKLRMSVLFSAEIQSSVAGSRSSRMRAVVSMPLSPTSAILSIRNRFRTRADWLDTVVGSAVLPTNTSTATGHPSRAHSSPMVICFFPALPARL